MTGLDTTSASPVASPPDLSIVIVSFNTRDILRECLQAVYASQFSGAFEVLIVDNASRDDSEAMVRAEFPQAIVFQAAANRGFGPANNIAMAQARGRYILLLNSDAFLAPDTLQLAMDHMDADPTCGIGGARLVGRQGEWQPSGRMFPTPILDAFTMLGLAYHYPKSKLFGKFDRTFADQNVAAEVDWVVGAFQIIRATALAKVGLFDERFFLYYEEVDLCFRVQHAGYRILYWPDLVVVHVGGESSRQVKTLEMSGSGAQLTLWRMRSALLYYRKLGLLTAHLAKLVESSYHRLVLARNLIDRREKSEAATRNARTSLRLLHQAWKETAGGKISPRQPW